jgi:hypothetical protein
MAMYRHLSCDERVTLDFEFGGTLFSIELNRQFRQELHRLSVNEIWNKHPLHHCWLRDTNQARIA